MFKSPLLLHNKVNTDDLIFSERKKKKFLMKDPDYIPRQMLYKRIKLKAKERSNASTIANRTTTNCSNISWRILTSTKQNEKESPKIEVVDKDNQEIKKEQQKVVYQKKKLKGKLVTLSKNVLIMEKNKYNLYKINLQDDAEEMKNEKMTSYENQFRKNHNVNIITKKTSDYFQRITPTFRYEDYYVTPEEFYKENFSEKEMEMIMADPNYFTIPNIPMKQLSFLESKTLSKIINAEDEKKVEPKVKKEIKTIKRKNTIDKVSKIHIDLRKKEYLLKKWKPKGKGKVIGFRASVPECPLLNMTYQDKIRQYSERREESAEVKRELFNQRKEKEKAKMILKQSLEKKKTNEKFEITKLVNTIHNIYLSKK